MALPCRNFLLSGCVALLLSAASLCARPVKAGPAGDAFYVPPAQLPTGPGGTVIWARPLDGTMALPAAAQNTLVLYMSVDPEGRPVAVSGTVSLPKGKAPAGGWPVITWTHGTTGMAAICGPSRDTVDGPEHPYIADIQRLLNRFVASGYAVVATDYEGLGVGGFHPFLQGVPNGQNALDMIRAARRIEPSLGKRYAVMGHSQGGQADLFTAMEGPKYAPELTLVGDAAFAPASNIAARLSSIVQSDKFEIGLPYLLYVLESYAKYNPEIDLKQILTAEAISHLPDLMVGCMTHSLTTGYWSTAIAKDQFLPQPVLGPFLTVAARNEPALLKIPVPSMILQGGDDVTVRPVDTDASVRKLCADGNVVDYRAFPGFDHNGSMVAGADDAEQWLGERFAGKPASGNCSTLPSAAMK
ncbi:alpha/beta fold hydrolase [Edaphobacter sp. HDX4]|uniref:lipase family protein n=1 Tax=Edaphobacter sp. HDX4 TaxID=2794064 RepID=UPI002FE68C43